MGIQQIKQWTYKLDGTGTTDWGDLCEAFAIAKTGLAQSPINIERADAHTAVSELPVTYHYTNLTFDCEMKGDRVFHAYPQENTNYLTYRGVKYHLTNWHMHMPSEHQMDGFHYPLEGHLVHTNEQGGVIVRAFFMKIGERDNRLLAGLAEQWQLAQSTGKKGSWKFNPATLIADNRETIYVYDGSLTTPPTLECVTWMVRKRPMIISHEQYTAFVNLLNGSNRPIQPLNGRIVSKY